MIIIYRKEYRLEDVKDLDRNEQMALIFFVHPVFDTLRSLKRLQTRVCSQVISGNQEEVATLHIPQLSSNLFNSIFAFIMEIQIKSKGIKPSFFYILLALSSSLHFLASLSSNNDRKFKKELKHKGKIKLKKSKFFSKVGTLILDFDDRN